MSMARDRKRGLGGRVLWQLGIQEGWLGVVGRRIWIGEVGRQEEWMW